MSGRIRSRRAGIPREQARLRPVYARILGLQFLDPSGFLCFVYFEGAIALGILLALAELVSWWGVLVLPLTVALMVKLNDVIAGALTPTTAQAAAGPGLSAVRAGVSASGAGLVVRPASARTSGRTPGPDSVAAARAGVPGSRVPGSSPAGAPSGGSASAGAWSAGATSAGSATGGAAFAGRSDVSSRGGGAADHASHAGSGEVRGFDADADDPRVLGVPPTGRDEASPQLGGRALGPAPGAAPGHGADGDVPLNTPPATRTHRDDQVDNPQQWARQSGSRRYQ